jgi:hypothetical protein
VLRLAALPAVDSAPSEPDDLAAEVVVHPLVFTLAAARGAGRWRPFARLTLAEVHRPHDPDLRFDAVRNPPPGMTADGPMARFRAPAYARAREQRSAGRLSQPG